MRLMPCCAPPGALCMTATPGEMMNCVRLSLPSTGGMCLTASRSIYPLLRALLCVEPSGAWAARSRVSVVGGPPNWP
eukprot:10133934-Alexandrium_andersonii.AAC.2